MLCKAPIGVVSARIEGANAPNGVANAPIEVVSTPIEEAFALN
ncbi:hypothetical protein [Ureibacillus thermophilus]|nr:hypothetical protein [Ureibacillus thermophilus]